MKKFVATLLILGMTATLAACGEQEAAPDQPAPGETPAATESPAS